MKRLVLSPSEQSDADMSGMFDNVQNWEYNLRKIKEKNTTLVPKVLYSTLGFFIHILSILFLTSLTCLVSDVTLF